MAYKVVSHVKRKLYEHTQYNIARHPLKKSKTVCFTEDDLVKAEWKEDKEFVLNGYSYDVVQVSRINGEKLFFCYLDKKDIIINSLVDLSKKLTVKKRDLRTQIDLQGHKKVVLKTSRFTILGEKEFSIFLTLDLNTIPNHYYLLESTHYLSISIPPPENHFV
ncbi:hypothetical protein [Chryseobacterium jejuense]|uniref:Uncharacterized protein n=1 Tax=Chryseobacterium jejuense TaxID=445960 RepID=A0A2X2Z719_CHRJE|nr:hypothetical protein [Chryseobacterium jejuense]SDJ54923.1 hypothetical protein SAMN05421542_3766 [Chryseobacterium jejuense]SQB46240.1 Uncharacterised protein [Chryseobacterium jejuense]